MVIRVFLTLLFLASALPVVAQSNGQKKNQRPVSEVAERTTSKPAGPPVYFYTFEKPDFTVPYIRIELDEKGDGTIYFRKKHLDEEFSKELDLSEVTRERLAEHWRNLDFLNSTSDYQSDHDYGHLGTMTLEMALGEKRRLVQINWTEDPDVKALTDEFKKIGFEYVWIFDIEIALINQPLETPKIMKRLEVYLRRGEISDPVKLMPYLRKLANDERMPLIARNHATRLVNSIEKKMAVN